MKPIAALAVLAALGAAGAKAQEVTRVGAPAAPIASVVVVPPGYDTVYVSGMTPPVIDPKAPPGTVAAYGDPQTQTAGVLGRISDALKAQGLSLADIVMMRVYLVGDPAKEGKMDFAGMMAAYTKLFATPEQPNKPSRVTVQVASLVGPGMMVEIEAQAVKKH